MQALLKSFAVDLGKAVSTAVVIWSGTPKCPDCILTCADPPRIPDCICAEGIRQKPVECNSCEYSTLALVCLFFGVAVGAGLHALWIQRSTVVGTVTTPLQLNSVPYSTEIPESAEDIDLTLVEDIRALARAQISQVRRARDGSLSR